MPTAAPSTPESDSIVSGAASSATQTASIAALSAQKRHVALLSMSAAGAMTMFKLGAGVLSGSLGVISDAVHSGLDLVGAALTFLSVNVSDKPADEDHTYGHGKIENLSAFAEATLMGISCAWIVWEAVQRIFVHAVSVRHSLWPVAVLLASIAVDYWRSRELRTVAQKTGSPALATDAFHFASDMWATLAVLAGLGVNWIGTHYGIAWLSYADPVAAIVVSILILRMTLRLGQEAAAVLVDEVPAEARRQLIHEVGLVPGVLAVEQARVRRAGANYFADLTLALPRRFTFEHTGQVVQEATAAVQRVLPKVDVVIHTVPHKTRAESIFDSVRAVAARNNVSVHELSIQTHQGRLRVELHVEIEENMRLRDAHEFVCVLEAEILRDVPEIDAVLTHIESEPATIEQPREVVVEDRRIEIALRSASAAFPEIADVHAIVVTHTSEHIAVTCHCSLPDDLPMHRVHEVITGLEDRFKLECPEVYRVTIHPEPLTDNTR
jgi:cation diffusion facilitator family transporter